MKKPTLIISALLLFNIVLLVAGGDGPSRGDRARARIGLVFDLGGLGDKSFNDSAYRGLQRAEKEFGVAVRYIEPGDGSDRENALRTLALQGAELIIGVGFLFTGDMDRLAVEFPATKWACIDYAGTAETVPANLVGLRFREHEGSYLVGALSGILSKTKVVAFVGGMKIPLIRKFEAGYIAGVKAVCPRCTVLSAYAGAEPKAFADPITGRELASAHQSRGADIIFHAAGKTGDGVFNAAREHGIFAIGVDSDQFSQAPCCVLTSMIKNVDVAVFETIRAVLEGRFQGGVREFGLAEQGVSFVLDENNRQWISDEVARRLQELSDKIVAGEITVPFE